MSMQEWLKGATTNIINVWLSRSQAEDKDKYIGMCLDNFSASIVQKPEKIEMYYLFS
jgi:hypothetical protein